MLDSLDYKAIEQLAINGRITWAELANVLELSPPSTAERIKRLEEKGFIEGYSARLNYKALGYSITAFVSLSLTHPKHQTGFIKAIHKLKEVEECHHIAGDDDYLLKVRCKSTEHLDQFLNEKLKMLSGVLKTRTTIVLSTSKELPIREVTPE